MDTVAEQLEFLYSLNQNENLEFNQGVISGNLIVTAIIKNQLLEFQEKCEFATIDISREVGSNLLDDVQINEQLNLSIELDRSGGIVFAKNLDDLISTSASKYCSEVPRFALLIDEGWRSWEEASSNKSILAYLEVVDFFEFLRKKMADHCERKQCHFFGISQKLSMTLKYEALSVISHADDIIKSISSLNTIMSEELHKEDKIRQLKIVLIDLLTNTQEKRRADSLLIHIQELTQRFIHNYELFISGFSFENEKEELTKKNREYTSVLNNVINSIHTRVIGIPLGTVIPALMIKSEKFLMTELNVVVFLSSVFIALVISFSLRSQWILLRKVREEYTAKWARMKCDIPNLIEELQEEFNHLESCFRLNRNLIIVFWIALFLFFLVPVFVFFDSYFGYVNSGALLVKLLFTLCISLLSLVFK